MAPADPHNGVLADRSAERFSARGAASGARSRAMVEGASFDRSSERPSGERPSSRGAPGSAYETTRARLETYFDRTAHAAWTALTSDAPVSRIRQTVREGRDAMRAALLAALPDDLSGRRVLDAGCGVGQLAVELARRGAEVVAVDIAPRLIAVAEQRTPAALAMRISYHAGDMLDPAHGRFDHAVAMDSLIHYAADDVAAALDRLAPRVAGRIVFTLAPKTPLLTAMHVVGKAFPRSDRSPAIAPVSELRLRRALARLPQAGARRLQALERVARGFYISQAYVLGPDQEAAR